MTYCNAFPAIFRKRDDAYNICTDDIKIAQNPKKTRKKFVATLCTLIVTFLLIVLGVHIIFINKTPKSSYDRSSDVELLSKVKVSKSAQKLARSGKLMCWVQTSPLYHDTRSLAINETWIHRCDHGQLFTSEEFEDQRIPFSTVFAGIPDTYYNLFFKSRYAFKYIHDNISKDFEWYMKADDDTYVIVENLKKYLDTLNPDEPHYLGYVLKPYLKNGYNAGGAGYVLSRAALKIFADYLYSNSTACPDDIYEDVGIAHCLESAGIFPEDTRNSNGQNRFNTFSPAETFHQLKADSTWVKYKEKNGYEAFANDLISFHHLTPDEIRLFDILLYRTDRL
ncbi:unnamed protein product [Caenorhabditis bovis]|uniref:N-acetylgalactosaminide beta-1,3-galactosyltransferase n=1 Tax=Caenorhabditis bovis TaxID=2654633 RepID=A0A8S1EBH0_9PELO|nr:unnamed protein product [Caenorhabditis bovis]